MKQIFKAVILWLLLAEAKLVLKKYKPRIIAVGGSVGKTSTKDAIYLTLKEGFLVRKSAKSFNSEIGLPLAILGVDNAWYNPLLWIKNLVDGLIVVLFSNEYPKLLILETGVDRPGDIRALIPWFHPDTIVFTRLPQIPAHVEYFSSPEDITKEKLLLIEGMKDGGQLIINVDDEKLAALKDKHADKKISTYGLSKEANVRASHYQISYRSHVPTGIRFKVHYEDGEVVVELPSVLGKQHMYPALAAITTAITEGVSLESAGQALVEYDTTPGRMRIVEGIKNTTIIDDSYNSSPVALEAALQVVEQTKVLGKKIVVLGDMLELGRYSTDEHKRLGRAAGVVVDRLITVGPRAKHFAEAAQLVGLSEKNILQFDSAVRAGKELQQIIESGDIVLIKGSQGIRLEKTVEEIMAHPERKQELLCRQDGAWLKR